MFPLTKLNVISGSFDGISGNGASTLISLAAAAAVCSSHIMFFFFLLDVSLELLATSAKNSLKLKVFKLDVRGFSHSADFQGHLK